MSKCNRMKLQLAAVAFDLEKVHESTQEELLSAPVRCAATCELMSDVLDWVWLGSWRDAEDPAALERNGITHVLNVAKEVPSQDERDAMARANVVSYQIPLVDAHSEDIVRHFETAFTFIEEARAARGRVLVHCRRGISRSPAIVVAYIMRYMHKDYHTALAFVKERRPCVSLNLAFREMLEDYDPATPLFGQHATTTPLPLPERRASSESSTATHSDARAAAAAHAARHGGMRHAGRQDSQCLTEEDVSCESDGSKPGSQCVRGDAGFGAH